MRKYQDSNSHAQVGIFQFHSLKKNYFFAFRLLGKHKKKSQLQSIIYQSVINKNKMNRKT